MSHYAIKRHVTEAMLHINQVRHNLRSRNPSEYWIDCQLKVINDHLARAMSEPELQRRSDEGGAQEAGIQHDVAAPDRVEDNV